MRGEKMKNINIKNCLIITDKDLIVSLVAQGFPIIHIHKDPKNPNRCIAYFKNTKELDDAILSFTNKTTTINIGEYFAADKRVRTLLYHQKTSDASVSLN